MRGVNEFVAAVADLVGGIGMLAFLSVLATLIVALLWYFWPRWLPRHWRLRFGFGRRGRQPGLGRSRWRLGALRWRWRLRWRRLPADPGRNTRGPPARHAARPPSRGPRPHRGPARRGGTVRRGRARAAPGHRPRPRGPRCRAAGSRVDRHRDRHRGGPGPAGARRPGLRGRRHLLRDLVRARATADDDQAMRRRRRRRWSPSRRSPWSVRPTATATATTAAPPARPAAPPTPALAPVRARVPGAAGRLVGDHRGARDRGPRPRRPGHALADRHRDARLSRLADCLAADGIAVERVTSGREAIRAATTGVATVFVPAPDFLHPRSPRWSATCPVNTGSCWCGQAFVPCCSRCFRLARPAWWAAATAARMHDRPRNGRAPPRSTSAATRSTTGRAPPATAERWFAPTRVTLRPSWSGRPSRSATTASTRSATPRSPRGCSAHTGGSSGSMCTPRRRPRCRRRRRPQFTLPEYRRGDRDRTNTGFPTIDAFPPMLWAGILLSIAVALLFALARGRRLGPPIAEPLPVLVPSAEVVTGRGRLYARVRGPEAMTYGWRRGPCSPPRSTLGGPARERELATPGPATDAFVEQVAARTGRSAAQIRPALRRPARRRRGPGRRRRGPGPHRQRRTPGNAPATPRRRTVTETAQMPASAATAALTRPRRRPGRR